LSLIGALIGAFAAGRRRGVSVGQPYCRSRTTS
jgi:hypothetical protein